jgi:zinc protease
VTKPGRLFRDRLPNGLELLVLPVDRPAAAVQLCIDAGAVDELRHEHGLAHLLEHMLFKGTRRRPVGRSAADVETWGGDLNAWTSMDQTMLHAAVDADGWEPLLDVIADMILDPVLDPAEVLREIDVVMEELRSYDNEPDSLLADHVQRALWGKHAYGRRIIGTERDLRGHDAPKLRALLEREYLPNRARLAVVGPVEPAAVLAAAHRLLGRWAPGPARRPLDPPPSKPSQSTVSIAPEFDSTAVEIAWLGPPPGHADHAPLEVFAHLLGNGAGAVLADDLQHTEHLAFGVWAELAPGLAGSAFSVGFAPLEKTARKAISATLERVEDLSGAVPGPAVERARASLVADFLFGAETVEGLATDLLWYASMYGDAEARDRHRDALHAVTPADVERAVTAWLPRDRAVVGVIDRSVTEAQLKRSQRGAARPARAAVGSGPHTWVHPKGPVVIVQPEDSPVVAVRVLGLGGDLRVGERQAGIPSAWARSVLGGAGDRDAVAIGEALDALAAELDPTTGRQAIGLAATLPSANLAEFLDLVGDVLLDPHFHEDDVERTREEMLDDLRTRQDRPSEVASDLSRALRWHGHPWRLAASGTEATVPRLTSRALRQWHDAQLGAGMVISIVGGVRPDTVDRALAWLNDVPEAVALDARPEAKPRLRGVHTLHAGHEQAHVWLTGTGIALGQHDRRGLELGAAMLDGQAGRMFLELRERRGLAYEIWASATEGLDGGTFRVGLATAPERVEEASAALRAVLASLVESAPTDEELERARRILGGRAALDGQRCASRAAALASHRLFGAPDPLPTYRARLGRITPDDVVREVRAMLDGGLAEIRVLPKP